MQTILSGKRNRRTSRERSKSAPNLRLNKTRKPLLVQLETTKALKKLKTEGKILRIFFEIFSEDSGKSHSAEKSKGGDPLGSFEHSLAKYQKKLMGGPLEQ